MAIPEKPTASLLPSAISKVAVIGAGAAGLPTAKRLREYGIEVVIFERNSVAGGSWIFKEKKPPRPSFPSDLPSKIDTPSWPPKGQPLPFTETYEDNTVWLRHAPPGACYDSLMNNIATPLMRFQGHEYPPGTKLFINNRGFLEYLQTYATNFGLESITRYNTRVEDIQRIKEGSKSLWKLLSRQLSRDELGKTVGTWSEETFDAVVVANGHYSAECIPDIPGLSEWAKKWPQDITHSKEFRRPENFEDKTVLVVGLGSSSLDICREVSPFVKQIYRSVRNKDDSLESPKPLEHIVRSLAPENLTQVADIECFGPVEGPLARESHIHLKDGATLEGVDRVVFCTGYLYVLPFLKSFHHDVSPTTKASSDKTGGADVGGGVLITDGMQVHNLHKDIFYIHDPTLTFVGIPFSIATFSFFDIQAMAVAAVFAGKAFLPTVSEMQSEYNARRAKMGCGRGFHTLGSKLEREYVDNIVSWVNQDAEKSGSNIRVRGHDEEWYQLSRLGPENLLRDILSRKAFYPDIDEQEIERRVQEQYRAMERIASTRKEDNGKGKALA